MTGRKPVAPRIQNIPVRRPAGRASFKALAADLFPKVDFAELERRFVELYPELVAYFENPPEGSMKSRGSSEATPWLHCYARAEGSELVMRCGARSRMPEQSAPYVDTARAFLGFPESERCPACSAAVAHNLPPNGRGHA